MKLAIACLAAVTALATMPLSARAYYLIGAGTDSCGTWTADRSTHPSVRSTQDEQWVLGFLSSIGYFDPGKDPLNGLDAEAVWAWIDNFCHIKPLSPIVEAAGAFAVAHPH